MALDVIRALQLAAQMGRCAEVKVRVAEQVASFLNNQKRRELAALEAEGRMQIKILGGENYFPEHLEMDCRDTKGNILKNPK